MTFLIAVIVGYFILRYALPLLIELGSMLVGLGILFVVGFVALSACNMW